MPRESVAPTRTARVSRLLVVRYLTKRRNNSSISSRRPHGGQSAPAAVLASPLLRRTLPCHETHKLSGQGTSSPYVIRNESGHSGTRLPTTQRNRHGRNRTLRKRRYVRYRTTSSVTPSGRYRVGSLVATLTPKTRRGSPLLCVSSNLPVSMNTRNGASWCSSPYHRYSVKLQIHTASTTGVRATGVSVYVETKIFDTTSPGEAKQ